MLRQKKFHFYELIVAVLMTALVLNGCQGLETDTSKERMVLSHDNNLSPKERLGKLLFFEKSLSTPPGQACSDCHDPQVAFANPESDLPVSRGARPGLYGNRNDLPVSYSAFIPPLIHDEEEDIWMGGLFWDGRANTLAEQAQGPPLNPLEMANPDTQTIAEKIKALSYVKLFNNVYGPDALSTPDTVFMNMADAIAAYEKTPVVNPFNSKYDYWLRGEAELSEQELRGLQLFEAEEKGNCAACHPSRPAREGTPPLFTDFTYDNLGVPKNPENPFYSLPSHLNPDGFAFVDLGLGVTIKDPSENGKFRVPTLRNVAITAPYMHNGVFKTLFQVISFYNSRDVANWPPAEVPDNVNREELGSLGLSSQEIEDLAAFLGTLTDGYNIKEIR